jgi:nitrous oxidase accessory protein NosD
VVRKALLENNIRFVLIYPYKHCKDEWIERFKKRGNNEGFIKFISDNWDNFIDDMDAIDCNIGKHDVGGLTYYKIHKEKLDNNKYIDSRYLSFLTDNSMGNMCSMYAANQ